MINLRHVLTIIILVSFSGCISQPAPSETSVPTKQLPLIIEYYFPIRQPTPSETSVPIVTPTFIPIVTPTVIPTHVGVVTASISLESSAKNITIYVPVLLDENKTVLKMYDTPEITGNVTTAIVDTEHGSSQDKQIRAVKHK
ncbi:MAG: hypothetical protein WCE94_13210 [Candidatus Methanoperedens sp.]